MSKNSDSATNAKRQSPESNNFSSNLCRQKRSRWDANSSRFKGVVALSNGHWGAQIYANHQRIWLGTFKSENEAAMAYDSAAIKIRNWDSHRNFTWSSINAQEPMFQSRFSTQEIISMIKDCSYPSKFSDYLKVQKESSELEGGFNLSKDKFMITQLFEKVLTRSDVGKLNRLVIPKKYAVSFFLTADKTSSEEMDVVKLLFYDKSMRPWRFRFCYWKSSQSYVFTRGWNEFVREKKLKYKDRVIFSAHSRVDAANIVHKFLMINVDYNRDRNDSVEEISSADLVESASICDQKREMENTDSEKNEETEKEVESEAEDDAQTKGFKLFGIQIIA